MLVLARTGLAGLEQDRTSHQLNQQLGRSQICRQPMLMLLADQLFEQFRQGLESIFFQQGDGLAIA